MTIIRTTKMKCSLFGAIIQKDGLFYKGLETIYFSIFLDMENGLFAKKIHDICFWLFQQMDSIGTSNILSINIGYIQVQVMYTYTYMCVCMYVIRMILF